MRIRPVHHRDHRLRLHLIWEVKPGYVSDSVYDTALKKYIDPKPYERNKPAEDYQFEGMFANRNVPGFYFPSIYAKMLAIDGKSYTMYVTYKGPGKVGYYLKLRCDEQEQWVGAKVVVPAVQDVYDLAREINQATTAVITAVGVFAIAVLSPILGDEAVGAGGVASAWASLQNIGLTAETLAILQELGGQLGYSLS